MIALFFFSQIYVERLKSFTKIILGCIKLLDVSTVIVTIFDIYACCYSFRQAQDYIVL